MEAAASSSSASTPYAGETASRELELFAEHRALSVCPELLPKHKIFISHSGNQKDFAEQLCEDLERWGYYPFFDKREDSLPKGEKFPPLIFKAARECLLAIVLLSEDFFTRSKWPMLELAAFVQAQGSREDLRILPVLLGLSAEDLKNTAKWSERWKDWGKEDSRLDCKVIHEWETAIQALKPVNFLIKSSYSGEVPLRKDIVRAVLKMMPADVRSDVSHVRGRDRLCKEILLKFVSVPTSSKICENAKVLGVYGIGGVGKSTLCMIFTDILRSEFEGRVCHVELGARTSTLNLQCKALKRLTGAVEDHLNRHISTEQEGQACLRERMPRQRVLLALDNVSDSAESIDAANMFLRLKFHPNSMVLVTSRSQDVLERSLGIPESCCVLCPGVTAEEALHIVLDHANIPSGKLLTEEQETVLRQTVQRSDFGGFHPLSLRVLAAQLGSDPSCWKVSDLDLHEGSDSKHPLFSTIETSYLNLPDQQIRDMFLDVALFTPENLHTVHEISKWLSDTIYFSSNADGIKKKLNILRVKSLLEFWKMDDENVRIHDLYHELAKRKAREEASGSRFVYQRGREAAEKELLIKDLAKTIERAGFVEAGFRSLALSAFLNLKLLSLRSCEKLATLCLRGMPSLVSLELSICPLETLDLRGLTNLRWLYVSSCKKLMELDAGGCERLACVSISKCVEIWELNLGKCGVLKSVCVSYNDSLQNLDLGSGQSLDCLTLWFCESLNHVEMSGVACLSTFNKRGCPQLLNISGWDNMSCYANCMRLTLWHKISPKVITALEGSKLLQVLDLWDCPMSRLPDLRACSNLRELKLSNLDVLLYSDNRELLHEYADMLHASAGDLGLPTSIEDISIASCRNVVVKEICWKLRGLRNLKLLLAQRVRVAWDWELYRCNGQNMLKASYSLSPLVDHEETNYGEVESLSEVHKQISMMGMEMKDVEVSSDVESVSDIDTGSENSEMSSEVESSSEVVHERISVMEGRESMENREVTRSLYLALHWVQEFLQGEKNEDVDREIRMQWDEHVGPLMIMQHEGIGQLSRNGINTAVDIGRSQGGIVEQNFRALCNSCDTFCEWLCQDLEPQDLVQVEKIMDLCQMLTAEEIKRQLQFLDAMDPRNFVMRDDELDMWDERIIDELAMWEKVAALQMRDEAAIMWEKRLVGEGVTLISPMVQILTKKLDELVAVRGWKLQNVFEISTKEGFKQWLRSCKIRISIEQLKFRVTKQASNVEEEAEQLKFCVTKQASNVEEEADTLKLRLQLPKQASNVEEEADTLKLHLQGMRKMMREIELLMQSEMEKKLKSSEADRPWCEGILRCWRTRQWLQELEICLSQKLMQADEKTPVTKGTPHEGNLEYRPLLRTSEHQWCIELREHVQHLARLYSSLDHAAREAFDVRERFAVERLGREVERYLASNDYMRKDMRKYIRDATKSVHQSLLSGASLAEIFKRVDPLEQGRMKDLMSLFSRLQEDAPLGKLIKRVDRLEEMLASKHSTRLKLEEMLAPKHSTRLKLGMMKDLMSVGEPPHPKTIRKGELDVWKRAERFPLRRIWEEINTHQMFDIPIMNCCMLRHLHISSCRLAIPKKGKVPTMRESCCIRSMELLEKQNSRGGIRGGIEQLPVEK